MNTLYKKELRAYNKCTIYDFSSLFIHTIQFENVGYMLFQSAKTNCNEEYVDPDPTNSTCIDDIGLMAQVRLRTYPSAGFCNTNF